jgi:hypothetical protein
MLARDAGHDEADWAAHVDAGLWRRAGDAELPTIIR